MELLWVLQNILVLIRITHLKLKNLLEWQFRISH